MRPVLAGGLGVATPNQSTGTRRAKASHSGRLLQAFRLLGGWLPPPSCLLSLTPSDAQPTALAAAQAVRVRRARAREGGGCCRPASRWGARCCRRGACRRWATACAASATPTGPAPATARARTRATASRSARTRRPLRRAAADAQRAGAGDVFLLLLHGALLLHAPAAAPCVRCSFAWYPCAGYIATGKGARALRPCQGTKRGAGPPSAALANISGPPP